MRSGIFGAWRAPDSGVMTDRGDDLYKTLEVGSGRWPLAQPGAARGEPPGTEWRLPRSRASEGRAADPDGDLLSQWMQAAQAGDAEAYRQLLLAVHPRIKGIVRARIHESAAADDVVQNALLSIHRGRATYRPERPFAPWMHAIVRNSIVDHFRERKRRGDRESEFEPSEWADERPSTSAEEQPLSPELQDALAGLPSAQREAVVLIQVEGLSVAEAALRAGVSPGALKVRAHRGYRALRQALEGAREAGVWRSAEPPPVAGDSSGQGMG